MKAKLIAQIFNNSLIYIVANIINAALPLALMPILTRILSPTEYAQIAMFQAVVGVGLGIVGFNTVSATGRQYYEHKLEKEKLSIYIGNATLIMLISVAVCIIFIWLGSRELERATDLSIWGIYGALAICVGTFFIQLQLVQWQVRGLARRYAVLQIVVAAATAGAIVVLVVLYRWGVWGRISAQIGSSVIFGLLCLVYLRAEGMVTIQFDKAYFNDALRFGFPLINHTVGALMLGVADRFILKDQIGLPGLAQYVVAAQIASGLGLVYDAINKAYTPWLFEKLKKNVRSEKRNIVIITYFYFVGTVLFATAAAICGGWLIKIIAGEKYADAATLIGIMVYGQSLFAMYLMVTNYVFYAKRTVSLGLVSLAAGFFNIGLLFLFSHFWGATGAAVAWSVAMGARFLGTWAIAQRSHPMPWFSLGKPSAV